jgi:signal transduction histidine kinase
MIATGALFYYTIRTIVYKQIDESLITEKTIIQEQIEESDTIPDFAASYGHLIKVRLLNAPTVYSQIINDTSLFDIKSDSYLPFRHLRFSNNTHKKTGYTISIYQLLDENTNLLNSVAIGMVFLFLSLLLVYLFVNYLVSKRLWSPFFDAVNEAAKFDILSDKLPELQDTNIDEFRQLNEVISQMTKKMRSDYVNLKEYNENSSHEIQTPLAIIRSKLDILMQKRNLGRESIELIRSINEATTRLFKLNQGLLLISKIENLQFPETKEISLKNFIDRGLANYDEILQLKKIEVETEISDPGLVYMNETLADVLISNLLSNTVRYNIDNGYIRCYLDKKSLVIENSGLPLEIDPQQVFKRFRKGTDNPQSVGLGLSIVKKIADHYKMQISYNCTGSVHKIQLIYRPELP